MVPRVEHCHALTLFERVVASFDVIVCIYDVLDAFVVEDLLVFDFFGGVLLLLLPIRKTFKTASRQRHQFLMLINRRNFLGRPPAHLRPSVSIYLHASRR